MVYVLLVPLRFTIVKPVPEPRAFAPTSKLVREKWIDLLDRSRWIEIGILRCKLTGRLEEWYLADWWKFNDVSVGEILETGMALQKIE